MRLLLAVALVCASLPAAAGEVYFTQQGRLLDPAGGPIQGDHTLTVTLYEDDAGSVDVWRSSYTNIPFSDGYYAVSLTGADATSRELDTAVGASTALYMSIIVDGDAELFPLQRPASSTLAARAGGAALISASDGDSCAIPGGIGWNDATKALYVCDGSNWSALTKPINSYQYYRIYADSWTNGHLLIYNVSMWEPNNSADLIDQESGYSYAIDSNTGGQPSNAADQQDYRATPSWPSFGIQTSNSGAHWWRVNFNEPKTIERFGVSGYFGGSHRPTGIWYLQGSADGQNWTDVWSGPPEEWIIGGQSYPVQNIIQILP